MILRASSLPSGALPSRSIPPTGAPTAAPLAPSATSRCWRRANPISSSPSPGGKGTANMIDQAKEAGIPVREIEAKVDEL